MMRIAGRLRRLLVIGIALIACLATAALVISQTEWFKIRLNRYIARQASRYLNGTVSIGRLEGNLLSGIELRDVGLAIEGRQAAAVGDLALDYNLFEVISKGASIDRIRIDKPVLHIARDAQGWSIARLVKKSDPTPSGAPRPISIGAIEITNGSIVVDDLVGAEGVRIPRRLDDVDASLALSYEPNRFSVRISRLSFQSSEPAVTIEALTGTLIARDNDIRVDNLAIRTRGSSLSVDGALLRHAAVPAVHVEARSDRLSVPEIAEVVPALAGISLAPALELSLNGPANRLAIDANIRSPTGRVTANLVSDAVSPRRTMAGSVAIRHLDLAPILDVHRLASDITADVRLDLESTSPADMMAWSGSVRVDAPRVAAAGFAVEAIRLRAAIERGRMAATGTADAYGATVDANGRLTIGEGNRLFAFDVGGHVRRLDLRRLPDFPHLTGAATDLNAGYHATGSIPIHSASRRGATLRSDVRFEPSTIAGASIAPGSTASLSRGEAGDLLYRADATVSRLDLQHLGEAFQIPTLAADRYRSSINGQVTAIGRGFTLRRMSVEARGSLTGSSLRGATIPRLSFEASLADDRARIKADGEVAHFDPYLVSGRAPLKGDLTGTIDVDGTIGNLSSALAPDNLQASGRITLDRSTIGEISIDAASLDGGYRSGSADIRSLDVKGPDFNLQANGTLALTVTGSSNLKFHAETSSLADFGRLVGEPLSGAATLDMTVTGNRRELQASGRLSANRVGYRDNTALALTSTYEARLPDLNLAQASLSSESHMTFAKVSGLAIDDLTAKTAYAGSTLTFDATARQPQRSLTARGALLMEAGGREIDVESLGFQTQGVMWQLAPGVRPTLKVDQDGVVIRNLALVNGGQEVLADGAVGKAAEPLVVSVKNVDLAGLDALFLRPPRLSGQVNGTLRYDGKGAALDLRLDETQGAWIAASGYLPTALLNPAADTNPAAPENRVDLHVDSSPIDLGMVQSLLPALGNVHGTLQAKIDVTGNAADPQPNGWITVRNGAFAINPAGVTYSALDGRIDLHPDRLHIDHIRLVDNHQQPLEISGDLAVHEREVGAISVGIKADDFKVIDNKMGNVRLKSDLRLEGELRYPRISGDLGVTTGRIDLDALLPAAQSPYSTTPTEYSADSASAAGARSSAYDALQLTVHLTVPNDFIVKGTDLRTPDAPIGLGAVNATLGGDLWLSKVPWDRLRLTGVVNTVRGTYDFEGRRFTLLRDGTVKFAGLDEIDPALDVKAERVIQAVTANVNLRGTLQKPEIMLSSVPPLEPAEVLALIAFNQPINQLGEGQQVSLAQHAEALAAGVVTGGLSRSIGKALNLDVFEITAAPGSATPAQIAIGQQVGQNLFVKVEQGIGDSSTTNFVLEYQLTDWLRMQSNFEQGASTQQSIFRRAEGTGADLIFFLSY